MRTFYRIETLDMDEGGIPKCGYMATVDALLCRTLGIKPDHTDIELLKAINNTKNESAKTVFRCLGLLCDIPIPEKYKKGQEDLYCLYSKEEYEEAAGILNSIWDVLIEYYPQYSFHYKTFKLKDSEIAYEDPYQVVITKEVYDKHKNDSKYRII